MEGRAGLSRPAFVLLGFWGSSEFSRWVRHSGFEWVASKELTIQALVRIDFTFLQKLVLEKSERLNYNSSLRQKISLE